MNKLNFYVIRHFNIFGRITINNRSKASFEMLAKIRTKLISISHKPFNLTQGCKEINNNKIRRTSFSYGNWRFTISTNNPVLTILGIFDLS